MLTDEERARFLDRLGELRDQVDVLDGRFRHIGDQLDGIAESVADLRRQLDEAAEVTSRG